MPRGYRRYIIAAFGWLILAASPPQDARSDDQREPERASAQALRDIATALQKANEPGQPDKGCERGDDARDSDLCAQWKAADAARDAAGWAGLTYGATVAALAIGFLTLFAAGFAAWYARKAWQETKRSADAAEQSISNDRAWLMLTAVDRNVVTNSTLSGIEIRNGFMFVPHCLNSGRTPALQLRSQAHLIVCKRTDPIPEAIWKELEAGGGGVLGPSVDGQIEGAIADDVAAELLRDNRHYIGYIFSRITYRDIFSDSERVTTGCHSVQFGGLQQNGTPHWMIGSAGTANTAT